MRWDGMVVRTNPNRPDFERCQSPSIWADVAIESAFAAVKRQRFLRHRHDARMFTVVLSLGRVTQRQALLRSNLPKNNAGSRFAEGAFGRRRTSDRRRFCIPQFHFGYRDDAFEKLALWTLLESTEGPVAVQPAQNDVRFLVTEV